MTRRDRPKSLRKRRAKAAPREFHVVIERDEAGYLVASVPGLPGCHTQARTMDTLLKRIREAIEVCIDDESDISTEFVGVQRITIAP